MKIKKFVLPTETTTKKEAIKMIRKCLTVTLAALIVIFNVLPAQAYTELATPVAITATGTLSGVVVAFSVVSVTQGVTPGVPAALDFGTVSVPLADSAEALMIRAKTNNVNNRLIVYTDNNLNTVAPNKAPTVNPATGIDGGGLVGQTEPGYSVALFWGTATAANNAPNTNTDYVFGNPSVPVEGGSGNCVYVVDKRHTASFTNVGSALDNATLYLFNGTPYAPANVLNDGLYPQLWDIDLYNSAVTHNDTTKVSPSLYSTIATVAFGIGAGGGTDTGYYVASVPQLRTLVNTDTITTRTSNDAGTAGTEMYIAIGGDYTSKPAQVYSTAKLSVALVQN